jgi:hypothetical protein
MRTVCFFFDGFGIKKNGDCGMISVHYLKKNEKKLDKMNIRMNYFVLLYPLIQNIFLTFKKLNCHEENSFNFNVTCSGVFSN